MTMLEMGQKVEDGKYGNEDGKRFMEDLQKAFMDAGANEAQAKIAADLAWEQGHAYGKSEIMIHAWDLQPIFGAK